MSNKPDTNSNPLSIVWLRRDLRLHDHAALCEALNGPGKVQPIFIFDTDILARFSNKQDRRLSFIAQALGAIHTQLSGGLQIFYGRPAEIIPRLAAEWNAAQVVCAEDYEPSAIARDAAVKQALPAHTRFVQVVDHVMMPPQRVLKDDGSPYKVFTPYSKAWRAALTRQSFDEKPVSLKGRLAGVTAADALPADDADAMLAAIGYEWVDTGEWKVEEAAGRLKRFSDQRMTCYHDHRDLMAQEGTSKLSPYLRFGLVSVRECARAAASHEGKGSETWMKELIWREFYAMILFHFPETVDQEFQEHYRGLKWEKDAKKLTAWQEARTGYPVVDAAMRQLVQTGWMHNRARMIVASFLTKDLLLDWRKGEEFFAQHLMDYEQASNVGGWQWAASTGTDAQPYFRIFNPELQSKKFDPEGDYIRRYVPELKKLGTKAIHAPYAGKDLFTRLDYPEPIVDHSKARDKALALFKGKR